MKDVQIDGRVSGKSQFLFKLIAMRTVAVFVPISMLFNIVLKGWIGIVKCPDFVFIN